MLIWYWLIPYGILEYNLAVNLFTSSIFMILTIILLNWFTSLRERIQWKIAKEGVYLSVQHSLGHIFDELLEIIEEGWITKIKLGAHQKTSVYEVLCELKDSKVIELDKPFFKTFFLDDSELLKQLLDESRNLRNI